MPLSEFHPATKGKLEPNPQSDVSSFMPETDFAELLWENGQIVMQNQSNRPKRPNFSTVFPSITGRPTLPPPPQERDVGGSPKSRRIDSLVNELSSTVPSTCLHSQEDMVPWMNYHMEDPDYCSDFFSEYPGLHMNSLPNSNNFGGITRESQNVEHDHTAKPPTGGIDSSKTKLSRKFESGGGNCNSHAQQRPQKQDVPTIKPLQTSSGTGVMNFSHFSRPVALMKANLQNVDRMRSNMKASTPSSSNPIESAVVDHAGVSKSMSAVQRKTVPVPPLALPPQKLELRSSVMPNKEAVNTQGGLNNSDGCGRLPDYNTRHSSSHASLVAEKVPETVVASSVCSGNSAGTKDLKQSCKRKNREGDESSYQSEDLEDESIGIKKPSSGKGASGKRSRAAEVHNLSERRRRDRINERMRALQELIPNCNKVDKASMLDEAIEYLKTLQLQVQTYSFMLQVMSMGSGLCVPPMMLPTGMQHLRGPPLAHFPTPMNLGMGMGMRMGYGMGMLDMHGSPGWQFPRIGMPGSSNVQMLGIPGQCLGMGMSQMVHPPTPAFVSYPGPSIKGFEIPGQGASSTSQGDIPVQQDVNINAAQRSGGVDDSETHAATQI